MLLLTFVDCGSSGQILYGKLREYLVPEVIKVNLPKINILTNKSKVSITLLVPIDYLKLYLIK